MRPYQCLSKGGFGTLSCDHLTGKEDLGTGVFSRKKKGYLILSPDHLPVGRSDTRRQMGLNSGRVPLELHYW